MGLQKSLIPRIDSNTMALVVGLGRSGIAAVKLLHKICAVVVATDSASLDKIDKEFLVWARQHDVAVTSGSHNDKLAGNVDLIVVSPGVPDDLPFLRDARERGVTVIGEMALATGLVTDPIVAITGTNGKSTVTELIGEMFKAAGRKVFVGGNLGQPLSEYLLDPYPVDVLVLEVSSFQLDTAPEFRPDVGILLNISPDHLDRYKDYNHYAASKFSMFSNQQPQDAAVLNGDDSEITNRLVANSIVSRCFFFGRNCSATDNCVLIIDQELVVRGISAREERYSLVGSELALEPNIQNSAAAVIAARLIGCSEDGVRKALSEFKPLKHRLAEIAEINGVRFLDDSKATNIGAVAAALAGMKRPVVLIAGGRDKGGDYFLLNEIVREKVKAMILIGEAREKMAAVFAGITRVEMAEDMPSAVKLAYDVADNGDSVLLSPACASFDMFKSYGHRGQVFKHAVMAMITAKKKI